MSQQHVNRNQVGLYVFILTAGALGLAGAGYLLGLDTPSWLTIFATTGLGSLATAWRPGSGTGGEPATPTPVEPQAAKVEPQPQPFVYPDPTSNPYLPEAADYSQRNDHNQRA